MIPNGRKPIGIITVVFDQVSSPVDSQGLPVMVGANLRGFATLFFLLVGYEILGKPRLLYLKSCFFKSLVPVSGIVLA